MKLVIDSNVIFSAIISPRGRTAELIFVEDLELFSARTLEREILDHKEEIIKKASISRVDFELLHELLLSKICFIEDEELFGFIQRAGEICPDKTDEAFFAVCLTKNLPLWSNDKKLKQQKVVKVISTEELVKEFR